MVKPERELKLDKAILKRNVEVLTRIMEEYPKGSAKHEAFEAVINSYKRQLVDSKL